MRFTGVSHTSFSVTDMDRSLAFYRDLLGMRVTLDLERTGEYIEQVVGFPDARLRIVGTCHRARAGAERTRRADVRRRAHARDERALDHAVREPAP